jgi:ABC-2 type transport system ATP-binding protein
MSIRMSAVSFRRANAQGSFWALSKVDFALQPGRCTVVLGPNGAGKSTASALLLGLLSPTEGRVEVLGGDPRDPLVRRKLGCIPQDSLFPEHATVRETLAFVASHFEGADDIEKTLERLQLIGLAKRLTKQMSGGQRRLLGLACALVGRPQVLVLDEPTTGLDPEIRQIVWRQLREQIRREKTTVVLTTHDMVEAAQLSDDVLLLSRGRLQRQGPLQSILDQLGGRWISALDRLPETEPPTDWPRPSETVAEESGVRRTWRVPVRESDPFVERLLASKRYHDILIRPLSLEQLVIDSKQDNPI